MNKRNLRVYVEVESMLFKKRAGGCCYLLVYDEKMEVKRKNDKTGGRCVMHVGR